MVRSFALNKYFLIRLLLFTSNLSSFCVTGQARQRQAKFRHRKSLASLARAREMQPAQARNRRRATGEGTVTREGKERVQAMDVHRTEMSGQGS